MSVHTEMVQQVYDRLSTSYDKRWHDYVGPTLHAILDSVVFQGRERVLDVACGTGELERLFLRRWPELELVGADVSQGMLCQASHKEGNKRVAWVQAEASLLPFADQSFDHVVCANSFHYFPSPIQALNEVHRVLRPGGSFVLLDWCDDYLSCKLCSVWLWLTDPAFCRTYTSNACQAMLAKAGFEVERKDCFRVGRIWGMMRFVCRKLA